MKKLFAALATLLVSAVAFGQSYPSPTYNVLTLQTPLAVSSGGTASASASGTALDNISGFSGTGFLTRTGAGAYSFQSLTNGITYANLAQAATNTVLGNATGSAATLAALSMPSCSTSSSALNWTTSGGASAWTCNTAINAATLGGTAAASYALLASPAFTGTPTAPTAALATNTTQIATTAFVIANSVTSSSPTITTPNIVGVTNGSNANAGSVGEVITATLASGSAVSLTTSTAANVTSISLTAGDWDVTGVVNFVNGSNNFTAISGWTSSASATVPTLPNMAYNLVSLTSGIIGGGSTIQVGKQRFNVSTTTTVFLSALANFASGTANAYGIITARRVR
ncbi:hypothetical protein AB4Y42_05480 [Paraburkholderia sp. EG286B]|uniref:hypothetical protein n=1 Tax=Paraburkholderia sp. EG286B TaxID=3237011 RepID=UPI0034D34B00